MTKPTIGLGCARLHEVDQIDVDRLVHGALDIGVRLFDTANNYGGGLCEEALGKAIFKRAGSACISTKFGYGPDLGVKNEGTSRKAIRNAVEKSLARLKIDRIDYYFVHGPDRRTPIEETLSGLAEIATEGKILEIGASNFDPWEMVYSCWMAERHKLPAIRHFQVNFNLTDLSPQETHFDMLKMCDASVWVTSPLRKGRLRPDSNTKLSRTIKDVAIELNATWPQVCIAWLAAQKQVDKILVGTTIVQHLVECQEALSIDLPDDVKKRLILASLHDRLESKLKK